MINIDRKAACAGCHACFSICPQKCIKMRSDEEGFLYPYVEKSNCTNCGLCEKVCPFMKDMVSDSLNECWAVICKDTEIRENSSSGGVFSLLSNQIIDKEGVVFGATFSDDWERVIHKGSTDISGFRSSKYVQSIVGEVFKEVKILLQSNKLVLFSGTPCQVTGLIDYLGCDYPNLFCVDVICHGVPSPLLWKKYVQSIKEKHKKSIKNICFRDKRKGWEDYGLCVKWDRKEYFSCHRKDPYMQMFLNNSSLRPSCYECKIKSVGSSADITLGDFWGIDNVIKGMNDHKGTSVAIIHTKKGEELFEKIQNQIMSTKVDFQSVLENNSALYKSVEKPAKREVLFLHLNQVKFSKFLKVYGKNNYTIKQRIARTALYKMVRPFVHKLLKWNS